MGSIFTPRSTRAFFMASVRKKGEGSVMTFAQVHAKWREMSPQEKAPFEAMHQEEKLKALEMKQRYEAYVSKVGPRLLDHDEQMELRDLAKRKAEAEQAYLDNKDKEKKRKLEERTT